MWSQCVCEMKMRAEKRCAAPRLMMASERRLIPEPQSKMVSGSSPISTLTHGVLPP